MQDWVRTALTEAQALPRLEEVLSVLVTQRAGKLEQDTITEALRLKQVLQGA